MKLPKKVQINGAEFKVVRDRKNPDSCFSYEKRFIGVGGRNKDLELTGFLHEIIEISCIERGMRFVNDRESGGNSDFLFSGNHIQFSDMIKDVTTIIKPMLK